MSYLFQLPTKIIFGIDAVNDLGKEISRYSANRALIITDPGVVKAGIHEILISCLKTNKIGYEIFSAVEPDPSIDTAIRAAETGKTFPAQVLVALGGDSAIDTAKSAALLSVNNENLKDFAGVDKVKRVGLPVIAIPTTAGTGSEATIFAVMSDPKNNDKFTISSSLIAPRVAILDPTLTLTLPPAMTAYTGMDALTHAVEAYTSVIAQPATDAFALKAIDLIMHNLRVAVGRGDNLFH